MSPLSAPDLPRVDLPPTRHAQVRRLLVDEAATSTRRRARGRWAAPLLVSGAVVATTVVATGDVHWTSVIMPGSGDEPAECYARRADLVRGDGMRLLPSADLGMTYHSWLNEERPCGIQPNAVLSLAASDSDGRVTAAVTVWEGEEVRPNADIPMPTAVGPDGLPVAPPTESTVELRGTTARLLDTGVLELTWSESGHDWKVTASGLEVTDVLDVASRLNLDDGDVALEEPGYELDTLEVVDGTERPVWSPIWYVCWSATGGGQCTLSLDIGRDSQPWQAALSTGPLSDRSPVHLVDIGGVPGLVTDNGGPGSTVVQWDIEPGVRAMLMGSNPSGVEAVDGSSPDDLVAVAESLEPVAADDPRIIEPPD